MEDKINNLETKIDSLEKKLSEILELLTKKNNTPNNTSGKLNIVKRGNGILVNGDTKPLKDLVALYKILSLANPGDKLKLTVKRDNKEIMFNIVLGEH